MAREGGWELPGLAKLNFCKKGLKALEILGEFRSGMALDETFFKKRMKSWSLD